MRIDPTCSTYGSALRTRGCSRPRRRPRASPVRKEWSRPTVSNPAELRQRRSRPHKPAGIGAPIRSRGFQCAAASISLEAVQWSSAPRGNCRLLRTCNSHRVVKRFPALDPKIPENGCALTLLKMTRSASKDAPWFANMRPSDGRMLHQMELRTIYRQIRNILTPGYTW